MTDSYLQAFELFDERIRPSAAQKLTAESRGQSILRALSKDDRIAECRLIGSLARSTAIRQFSDVDILAVFDPHRENDQPNAEKLLDLTAKIVRSFSPVTTRSPMSISLDYSDWPKVDILPAFPVTTDNGGLAFRVPADAQRSWQIYLPSDHDRIVQNSAARLGPRFKMIVRAIKWWNSLDGDHLRSYKIEQLVGDAFQAEIPAFAEAVFRAFDRIMGEFANGGRDDSGAPIPAHLTGAWLLARQARDIAVDESNGPELADIFRRLFGEQFPLVRS